MTVVEWPLEGPANGAVLCSFLEVKNVMQHLLLCKYFISLLCMLRSVSDCCGAGIIFVADAVVLFT